MDSSHIYNIEFYKSLSGEAAFEERIKGRLPILGICDHPFFVDVRMMRVRPMDVFSTEGLNVKDGGYHDSIAGSYSFFYDPKKMEAAQRDPLTGNYGNHVVMIRFPLLERLDPVGMARLHGKDERAYLTDEPMRLYYEAEVIPLQKMFMSERKFIEHNQGKKRHQ